MRYLMGALLSVLALTSAAPAQRAAGASVCAISAFVTDSDPRGLSVRAGPSAQARVLRTVSTDGSGLATITGHSAGWFRVSGIVEAETDTPLFAGDGWVHQSLLATRVAHFDPRLYSAPRERSRVLARLGADEPQVTLIGCSGAWAQVRAAGRAGWLSPAGQCSNPLTSCS